MQTLIDSYKNTGQLHHAYVVEGDIDNAYKNICEFCENDLNFKVKANPHFIYESYEKFLVDDARRIRELQMNKNREGQKQIFVLSFNFITTEAQNSLLKVLEEPTKGTHFFILTPSSHIFLDTIKSRVSIFSSDKNFDDTSVDFLGMKLADRLKFVTKLVKDIKDEKTSKSDALKIVRNLEMQIHRKVEKSSGDERVKYLNQLRGVNKVADYLHDNSASVKQLLEYTATII